MGGWGYQVDMLCNGSVGTVIGVQKNESGNLTAIIVNSMTGNISRLQNPAMA